MFKNTLDNKRYHTLNYYLRKRFNEKVIKIPISINSTCPNKKTGGCIYCKDFSKANIIKDNNDLLNTFNETKSIMSKKWPNAKYIAYFQSGTNTYGDINKLKPLFEQFLNIKDVIGIAIATRPDCINKECLTYLSNLNKKTFLSIELGLQTQNNDTLKLINRGHTKEDFTSCVKRLQKHNIFITAHIINGLPFETKKDMLNTVTYLNDLKINAIKIHMLFISKETALETLYNKTNFHVLSKEEYIDIVCSQLEHINENIVIARITGDPIKEDLVEPAWLLKKFILLNDIDKEMLKRNIYQGDKL